MNAVVLVILSTAAFAAQAEPDPVKASFDRMLERTATVSRAPSAPDIGPDPLRQAIVAVLWRSQPPFHPVAIARR